MVAYVNHTLLSSVSIAPPPGTTHGFFNVLRTIIIASCSDRCASSKLLAPR